MTYWVSGQSTAKDNKSVYEFDDYYYCGIVYTYLHSERLFNCLL